MDDNDLVLVAKDHVIGGFWAEKSEYWSSQPVMVEADEGMFMM